MLLELKEVSGQWFFLCRFSVSDVIRFFTMNFLKANTKSDNCILRPVVSLKSVEVTLCSTTAVCRDLVTVLSCPVAMPCLVSCCLIWEKKNVLRQLTFGFSACHTPPEPLWGTTRGNVPPQRWKYLAFKYLFFRPNFNQFSQILLKYLTQKPQTPKKGFKSGKKC